METAIYFIIGAVFAFLVSYVVFRLYMRHSWKTGIDNLFNSHYWCIQNCKAHEYCYSKHKDPDDADDELLNEHCTCCPIPFACTIIDADERAEKEKKLK